MEIKALALIEDTNLSEVHGGGDIGVWVGKILGFFYQDQANNSDKWGSWVTGS